MKVMGTFLGILCLALILSAGPAAASQGKVPGGTAILSWE